MLADRMVCYMKQYWDKIWNMKYEIWNEYIVTFDQNNFQGNWNFSTILKLYELYTLQHIEDLI